MTRIGTSISDQRGYKNETSNEHEVDNINLICEHFFHTRAGRIKDITVLQKGFTEPYSKT